MQRLDRLENQSIYLIREAYRYFKPISILWSLGKDSNVMLWLMKKAFCGRIPFPAVHIDTGKKFKEMYEFRSKFSKAMKLDLRLEKCPSINKIDKSLPPAARSAARKTEGLKTYIKTNKIKGVFAGIRRDEQSTRAKERMISPRSANNEWNFKDQPIEVWDYYINQMPADCHVRVHPLLNWTEVDVWEYTKRESIPVINLYFSKKGKRYRSLGDQDITFPVKSDAKNISEIIKELKTTKISERSGRSMDHETEDAFERLRSSGYL